MLVRLPPNEQAVLEPHLRPVLLSTKREINEVGCPVHAVYFPIDCAVSLLSVQESGRMVEVAVIGKEGCSAVPPFPGLALARTLVQVGGRALQLDVSTLQSLLPRVPAFQSMMSRFGALLFREAVISVGCSQYHTVEQRLGRWLLSHVHRTGHRRLPFTHDFLADQLGVQRVTVTEMLAQFQRKSLVHYGYGEVEVIEAQRLEAVSCDCFSRVRDAIAGYLRDLDGYAGLPPASRHLTQPAS